MLPGSKDERPIGERLRQDRRSTSELVEAALAEGDRDPPEGEYLAVAVLTERGTRDVLDAALALSSSPDPERRVLGARILGQLGSPERTFPERCCDALLDLLRHDHDRQVLITTIFAFGHLRNPRCEPDLIALRDHPDDEVRHGVAFALCGSDRPASVQALLEMMEDHSFEVRDWAATGIGGTVSLDGPEIRAALPRRATDTDEITRAEALHGLARRRDKRVVPYLIAELSAEQERMHLFVDAAKTFVGIDEDTKVDSDLVLASLQAVQCGV
jgi:HEAT repeat protein